MDRPDPPRLEAWRSLLEAHAALTEVLEDELLAACGLPLAWYEVLLHLHEGGGRSRMQELAYSVLLSKSGVTRLVDRMVVAGLVVRESCPNDRRGTLAVLTDDGRSKLRAASPVHLRGVQEHFGRFVTPDEAEVVSTALTRVVAGRDGGRRSPRCADEGEPTEGGSPGRFPAVGDAG
ncbi:MAG: hypothetical protein AVDCRST_MAG50-2910 [uncultured Acidimicrobiales bacterium]|uniref:HTH marR-type domain-containing protein n=1 Tax=uncultured Acidimicrobiales bacterium TaxID=310071 RepID=A0A6J4IST9_9ACTN|nr:MAG: hypothetical protein AVDCRST_MAG50-2910 [uncultured Acidimicrobiales bacterium]